MVRAVPFLTHGVVANVVYNIYRWSKTLMGQLYSVQLANLDKSYLK